MLVTRQLLQARGAQLARGGVEHNVVVHVDAVAGVRPARHGARGGRGTAWSNSARISTTACGCAAPTGGGPPWLSDTRRREALLTCWPICGPSIAGLPPG